MTPVLFSIRGLDFYQTRVFLVPRPLGVRSPQEAFGSQAEEGSDHEAEAFRFLGIPVSQEPRKMAEMVRSIDLLYTKVHYNLTITDYNPTVSV